MSTASSVAPVDPARAATWRARQWGRYAWGVACGVSAAGLYSCLPVTEGESAGPFLSLFALLLPMLIGGVVGVTWRPLRPSGLWVCLGTLVAATAYMVTTTCAVLDASRPILSHVQVLLGVSLTVLLPLYWLLMLAGRRIVSALL